MKRIYLDMTGVRNNEVISVIIKDAEIIQAGTTVYSMPIELNDEEYQKFADCYDIHFIFDDMVPDLDFYTVPYVNIMAVDSQGGYIGTVGGLTDIESELPICYIDKSRNVFWLAENFKSFIEKCETWKEQRKPYNGIKLFSSKDEAMQEYEFVDTDTLKLQ